MVTRFFWPPLMPRIMWLPTFVSAHTCRARSASQTGCQAYLQQQTSQPQPWECQHGLHQGANSNKRGSSRRAVSRVLAQETATAPAAHGCT